MPPLDRLSPSRYWELDLPSQPEVSEGLTNFLWELGALGVVEEQIGEGPARLRAFFPDGAEPCTLAAHVRAYLEGLAALGLGSRCEPRIVPLVDDGWAEAWRAHFKPVAVGRRLIVAPPWETPFANGRIVVTIEPGRAFGTGHHGTTAGCLDALESIADARLPERAIDVGTGSGILAIAAARIGVPSILAIDEDPDAIASAVANTARNSVADRVRCVLADASVFVAEPAPLVMANILTAAHVRLAVRYRALVTPGGALVLGGLLDAESPTVEDALVSQGFLPRASLSIEGWTTLVLARGDDDGHRGRAPISGS